MVSDVWHKQPRSDLQGIRGDVMISTYNFKNDENPSKDFKQEMTSMYLVTSLVVQWSRICLPVQGMWVRPLVGELYPTCLGASKPVCHNHCVHAAAETRTATNK